MPTLPPPFTIRPATEADTPTIFTFIKKLADYEKLSHAVTATESSLRESLFGPRPYAEVLLAFLADQPVGYALYFHNFSTFIGRPTLYLEDLFVDIDHRGKGFGKALLLEVIKLAKARRSARVEWCVLNWNKPAIDFYESLGAVPMNDWTVYRLTEEKINSIAV